MLLFKYTMNQPRLNFNTFHVVIQHIEIMEEIDKTLFQYIPCYYSTHFSYTSASSYLRFQYIPCCYSTKANMMDETKDNISIHSLLLFNQRQIKDLSCCFSFQYIPCCYSTKKIMRFAQMESDFNTSHVVIQPTKNRHSCILLIYINNDLKPFLSCFTNHTIEKYRNLRNHVFTPFDRLF